MSWLSLWSLNLDLMRPDQGLIPGLGFRVSGFGFRVGAVSRELASRCSLSLSICCALTKAFFWIFMIHPYIFTCIHAHMRKYMHARARAGIHTTYSLTHTYTIHTYMCHTHIHACVFVCVCVCVWNICRNIHIHVSYSHAYRLQTCSNPLSSNKHTHVSMEYIYKNMYMQIKYSDSHSYRL